MQLDVFLKCPRVLLQEQTETSFEVFGAFSSEIVEEFAQVFLSKKDSYAKVEVDRTVL